MGLFNVGFDANAQATLDRLIISIALLTTAIKQTGANMTEATDRLANELAKLTATEQALSAAVQAEVAARQEDAAKIADLANQLALANSQSDEAAIDALVSQLDTLADKFAADAQTLQGAVPPPQT